MTNLISSVCKFSVVVLLILMAYSIQSLSDELTTCHGEIRQLSALYLDLSIVMSSRNNTHGNVPVIQNFHPASVNVISGESWTDVVVDDGIRPPPKTTVSRTSNHSDNITSKKETK